jgi:hypothetical protein
MKPKPSLVNKEQTKPSISADAEMLVPFNQNRNPFSEFQLWFNRNRNILLIFGCVIFGKFLAFYRIVAKISAYF